MVDISFPHLIGSYFDSPPGWTYEYFILIGREAEKGYPIVDRLPNKVFIIIIIPMREIVEA